MFLEAEPGQSETFCSHSQEGLNLKVLVSQHLLRIKDRPNFMLQIYSSVHMGDVVNLQYATQQFLGENTHKQQY